MKDDFLNNLALSILFKNEVHDLYKKRCESLKYVYLISRKNYNDEDIKFPEITEIINKYWGSSYKTKHNKIIKFSIYNNVLDGDDRSNKCYFVLGILDLNKAGILNYIGNVKKVFVTFEKNYKELKFFSEPEVETLFGGEK